MKIAVIANDEQFKIISKSAASIDWLRLEAVSQFSNYGDADAFFNLNDDAGEQHYAEQDKPLFLNSVIAPLPVESKAIRINGWPGFLENDSWEISGTLTEPIQSVLDALAKKAIVCANEPGFISARIVAMIINEAFFAKEDGVSTEQEIDTAMKLGTNYPYGPFEWAEKIGIENIYRLLSKMAADDNRYTPADALTKTINN